MAYRAGLADGDVLKVQEEIHVYEVAIASVEAEMQELSRQANILRHKKNHYLDLIAKCRGKITLAVRAPDEVLAAIFEQCAYSGWNRAPLVLSHVCKKWRQSAMAPSVWACVHVGSDSLNPEARTRLWLSRARETPLHISTDIESLSSPILSALHLLLARASQWRSFALDARTLEQANDVLALCASHNNLRLLEELSVTAWYVQLSPGLTQLQDAFANSPNLHTVVIKSDVLPPCFPSQLRNLHMDMASWELSPGSRPPLETLSALPHLTSLTLTAPIAYLDPSSLPLTFPHLESLTLNAIRGFNPILNDLHTPKLTHLRFLTTEGPLTHPHEPTGHALRAFLARCTPPLTHLELHDVDLPHADFLACFALLPRLEFLRLHETEITNEAFVALYGPNGHCPRLARLDLRWCEQLAGETLVALVASRLGPTPPGGCVPIEWIRVINCAVVRERDVLELARTTVCSVVVEEVDDYCRLSGCCNNFRYRQRMRLRHIGDLRVEEGGKALNLILE